ncbi:MAG: hypothetical protein ABIJ41_04255 [Candidatus Omnitrophota bacterium]
MKKVTLLLCFFCLGIAVPLWAQDADNILRYGYAGYNSKDQERWSASVTITPPSGQEEIGKIVERGGGRFSAYPGITSWVSTLEFREQEDSLQPLQMEKNVYDQKGQLIERTFQAFDYDEKKVTHRNEKSGSERPIEKVYGFGDSITNKLLLGLFVQEFLQKGERHKMTYFISDEPRLYNIDIRIVREEEITVRSKKRKAFKLMIDPNLGIFNIFKIFLPRAYLWHAATKPYEWLQYEGPESNPTSIRIQIRQKY